MEPALHSAQGPLHAWLLPGEGAICTVSTLTALHATAPNVQWHWRHQVHALAPGLLHATHLDRHTDKHLTTQATQQPQQPQRVMLRLGDGGDDDAEPPRKKINLLYLLWLLVGC